MTLEIIRDEVGFAALEPWWDVLLEQSATRTPFLRWDWVRLWWAEFHTDFTLAITVLRDAESRPLAIAPLMIGQENDGMRRHLRHLGFLAGLGEAKGERMDFLVPAGRELELTPRLCQAFQRLEGEWEAIRLNKVPEESPNYCLIVKALSERYMAVGVVTRTECLCIQLQATWSDFETRMEGKRRREIRRRAELLRKDHAAIETMVSVKDVEARMDEFAVLHTQHYPEGVSSFITPRAWRFHRSLAVKWIAEGRAILPFIGVETGMAGGIYGFIEGVEFFFYQVGWNPEYARYSMGHLSIRWAAECCMARGVTLFDMLPGTYRYKTDWSHTSRYVLDLEAYQPESLRATLFRSVRYLKRMLSKPTTMPISE